jgi:hypothetical protein
MQDRKKVTVKIMENITDTELNQLVEGLKKIEGFAFSIDSFVLVASTASDQEKGLS